LDKIEGAMVQQRLFEDDEAPGPTAEHNAPDPDAQLPERFPVSPERSEPSRRKIA
jgi:hypothetical protein